ncbi:MAG TPA: hypothetical protein VJ652_16460 [Noviherbaspirillum sp.]|nr:hypothetical protein [Noviherbaspirillum sp.]
MTINMVTIKAGHRAGQFGELSELDAPAGQVYVRLAPHEQSRRGDDAKKKMEKGEFGAVTLQSWDDIEGAA